MENTEEKNSEMQVKKLEIWASPFPNEIKHEGKSYPQLCQLKINGHCIPIFIPSDVSKEDREKLMSFYSSPDILKFIPLSESDILNLIESGAFSNSNENAT